MLKTIDVAVLWIAIFALVLVILTRKRIMELEDKLFLEKERFPIKFDDDLSGIKQIIRSEREISLLDNFIEELRKEGHINENCRLVAATFDNWNKELTPMLKVIDYDGANKFFDKNVKISQLQYFYALSKCTLLRHIPKKKVKHSPENEIISEV